MVEEEEANEEAVEDGGAKVEAESKEKIDDEPNAKIEDVKEKFEEGGKLVVGGYPGASMGEKPSWVGNGSGGEEKVV